MSGFAFLQQLHDSPSSHQHPAARWTHADTSSAGNSPVEPSHSGMENGHPLLIPAADPSTGWSTPAQSASLSASVAGLSMAESTADMAMAMSTVHVKTTKEDGVVPKDFLMQDGSPDVSSALPSGQLT